MPKTVEQIVKNFRGEISLRDFAESLTAGIEGLSISYQTISNWENGTKPDKWTLVQIAIRTSDWRQEFALEVLCNLDPRQYAEISHYLSGF